MTLAELNHGITSINKSTIKVITRLLTKPEQTNGLLFITDLLEQIIYRWGCRLSPRGLCRQTQI